MNKSAKNLTSSSRKNASHLKLKASPGSRGRKVGTSSKQLIRAKADRKNAFKKAKEWLRDPEMQVQSVGWHQISKALGGIFIYRTVEMTSPDIDFEGPIEPFNIASADELCREFGDKEGLEMAQACAELSFSGQRKLAIALLRKNKANRPSSAVAAALKTDGIEIDEFLKA